MKKVKMDEDEVEDLKKKFPKVDLVSMLSKHSPIYRGNLYPLDGITKPLINVYFYINKSKIYCYHSGYVWIAPEERVYVKIMSVFTLTKDGKIKVMDGKEYYFGIKK